MTDGFDSEVTVRRARYADETTGFAVLDARAADGSPVVIVGPIAHLEPGDRARVQGAWVTDSRFGPQVKVTQAAPLAPTDGATVLAYLQRVRHVGARRAERLLDRFGVADTLDAVDRDPAAAFALAGLRGARAAEAVEAWDELRVTRSLHLRLAPHGLAYLVPRVHEEYGSAAHRVIVERPYELTSVFGVGFALADRIARAAGVPDGHERARAGALHLLAEAERSGSTCLPADELDRSLAELLGTDPPAGAAGRPRTARRHRPHRRLGVPPRDGRARG